MIKHLVRRGFSLSRVLGSRKAAPVALALGILAAGCSDITGLKVIQLAQNRALWESQRLHSYTVQQTVSCFCQYSGQPVNVRVDADTVTSAFLSSTGAQIDRQGWQTIPELFDYARQLLDGDGYTVKLRFQADLGYPELITYSCPKDLLDCGGTLTARMLMQPQALSNRAN